MHVFRVWAPHAHQVDLVLPGTGPAPPRREPLRGQRGGWWAVEVHGAGHGTDYAFSLDGGPDRPDPRSAWQPHGVHGPSRVFSPERHRWADDAWPGADVRGAVCYELHVGTFTAGGTLDAAIARLDHLVALGVDVVELMPVAAFDGDRGWGYDGVALYAVHEGYGGPAALQRFVDACHVRGLGVCLDVVHNHLGPSGNYLPEFGPYFTSAHTTPWGEALNLDGPGSTQVRRWVCDSAAHWLRDFHLDGLRLDAVHALRDGSARHLLQQLSDEVAALSHDLGRPLSLVAESDLNDPRTVEPTEAGGLGMTAQWADDVHHALHVTLTGERQGYYTDFAGLDVLARTLTRVFRHAGEHSAFRGRPWGRPIDPDRHRGHQFVVSLQNHDQVGNRAAGDRLSGSVPPGLLAGGAALLLGSAFTPMLFMGEEWGAGTPWPFFSGFPDPGLAAIVRDGRRAEFARHGWPPDEVPDPQDPATRDSAVLDWSEPERPAHARLLAWYRELLALRRREPDLRADDLREVGVEVSAPAGPGSGHRAGSGTNDGTNDGNGDGDGDGGRWVVVRRGRVHILVNLADRPAVLPGPEDGRVLLSWDPTETVPGGWRLPGHSTVFLDGGNHR
jgi:maltooligosyltrehalose trehalohydrolase